MGFELVSWTQLIGGRDPTFSSDSKSVTMGDPNGHSQSNFVQKKFNYGSFWAIWQAPVFSV